MKTPAIIAAIAIVNGFCAASASAETCKFVNSIRTESVLWIDAYAYEDNVYIVAKGVADYDEYFELYDELEALYGLDVPVMYDYMGSHAVIIKLPK